MSVQFVKVCALCGHSNLSIASFCSACDGDLMNVAPTLAAQESDEKTASPPGENSPQTVPSAPTSNAVSEAETPEVEITTPLATRAVELVNPNEEKTRRIAAVGELELELVANSARRFRVRDGQSVGRSNRSDVVLHDVPDLDYISRQHVRLFRRREQWFAQYLGEGNCILVDGTKATDATELALHDGSILTLSYTAFRVRLLF